MNSKNNMPEPLFELLRNRFSSEEICFLSDAYDFAENVHKNQKRDGGEPYIIHPVAVAEILAKSGADPEAIAAGLLHDTVEDGDGITIQMIQDKFGESVAFLVDAVTKVPAMDEKTGNILTIKEVLDITFKKLTVAIEIDKRAADVKLADRLHNMRTIGDCSEEKKLRKSMETVEKYIPMAHRLGYSEIENELSEICGKILDFN